MPIIMAREGPTYLTVLMAREKSQWMRITMLI
jgi:hypothetical protein